MASQEVCLGSEATFVLSKVILSCMTSQGTVDMSNAPSLFSLAVWGTFRHRQQSHLYSSFDRRKVCYYQILGTDVNLGREITNGH